MTHHAVVVGGGTMGAGIAYVFAQNGYRVEVVDPSAVGRQTCMDTVGRVSQRAVEQDRISESDAQYIRERLTIHAEMSGSTEQPRILVEAVPEEIELKRRVLREAEQRGPLLLATNTSSISINALAESLERPDLFLGMHFFNPVWSNPLLEIVTGSSTSASSLAMAADIAAEICKESIVVQDSPGFASSRLGVALGLEAIRMVEQGVASAEDIDRAMEVGYRHPMGPLHLTDLVGLDVRLGIARNLERELGSRFAPPQLLVDMVSRGELGKKTGRGFFNW